MVRRSHWNPPMAAVLTSLCIALILIGRTPMPEAATQPGAQNSSPTLAQNPKSVAERLGYPANARLLILHADDVGMLHTVNQASFEALDKHWVTSASLLVVGPWFPEAARYAKAHPEADLGIHLALNSEWTTVRWGPVSRAALVPTLIDADGYLPLVEDDAIRQDSVADVEHELRAQIEKARAAGVHITHLDSHMGTLFHTRDLLEVYARLARSYRLPVLLTHDEYRQMQLTSLPEDWVLIDRVLQMSPGVPAPKWVEAYKSWLQPLAPGIYEVIVHLGYDNDELRGATADHPDWGAAWRQSDFDLVRNTEFQRFVREQGLTLIHWKDLTRALPPEVTPAE